MTTTRILVKVVIALKDDAYAVETLRAERLRDGFYRLRNVPILAYGYSEQDVVSAADINDRLVVTGVAQRSGHSTDRLFFPAPVNDVEFQLLWKPLERLGCSYERANPRVIGIDVPPESGVYAVYALLERGEQERQWTFEEGHCGHRLRK